MKKFLTLIINGLTTVLAFVSLFLGFSQLASKMILSYNGTTITQPIDSKSFFDCLSSADKFRGTGIVIIIFLIIIILLAGLLVANYLLKNKSEYDRLVNVTICLLSLIVAILYLLIPTITKESETVGSAVAMAKIGLAAGPIVSSIFCFIVAAINLLPVICVAYRKLKK